MGCKVCGGELPAHPAGGSASCPRCAFPAVPEEAARALLEAEELLGAGSLDRSIRRLQHAAKLAPESHLPRLRIAAAYERKAREGEAAFLRLADRESREAVRLAPLSRDAHVARLGIAAKMGGLMGLKAHYEARVDEHPFAGECLKMIEALEEVATTRSRIDAATGGAKTKARHLFFGAAGAGFAGLVQLALVIYRSLDDDYVLTGSLDFYICVVLLTTGGVLALEGWRALRR